MENPKRLSTNPEKGTPAIIASVVQGYAIAAAYSYNEFLVWLPCNSSSELYCLT